MTDAPRPICPFRHPRHGGCSRPEGHEGHHWIPFYGDVARTDDEQREIADRFHAQAREDGVL
jgi:hypothetical protein